MIDEIVEPVTPVTETFEVVPEEVVQLITEEQLAERLAARDAEWQSKLSAKDAETSAIRTQFDAANIERSLTDAATKGSAFSTEQILNVLQSKTSIVNGVPVVRIEGFDLSPSEAVQWMRSQPDRYGNLFKANTPGGLGGGSTASGMRGPSAVNVRNLSPAEYRRMKVLNPKGLGLRGDS